MSRTAADPAATIYLNAYTLYPGPDGAEASAERGVFEECLGTCAPDAVFDTLLALPTHTHRAGRFILIEAHPGADFDRTTTPPSP